MAIVIAEAEGSRPWIPDSFMVELDGPDLSSLGIEFRILDGDCLVVDGLHPDKTAERYNDKVETDLQILPGDRVAAVNGWAAPASAMLKKFTHSSKVSGPADCITITLQRAILGRIKIQKNGRKLGLIVNHDKTKTWCKFLQVEALNDGAILEYNRSCGSRGLRIGDRIVAVNGQRGKPTALLRELGTNDVIEFSFIPAA